MEMITTEKAVRELRKALTGEASQPRYSYVGRDPRSIDENGSELGVVYSIANPFLNYLNHDLRPLRGLHFGVSAI